MSTVIRPSGPLPPKVYWVRRLLLLSVTVLLTVLVWWLVAGPGDAQQSPAAGSGRPPVPAGGTTTTPTATTPTATTSTTPPPTAATSTTPPSGTNPATTRSTRALPPDSSSLPDKLARSRPTTESVEPLATPTGDCDPTEVDMTIEVSDVRAGRENTATFQLTSLDSPACTLSITPQTLLVKVTSGDDNVWSSDDCPDALPARQIVVRRDQPTSYEFMWNGERSADGCQTEDGAVEPGGYYVEAALIGGEPHEAFFDIT